MTTEPVTHVAATETPESRAERLDAAASAADDNHRAAARRLLALETAKKALDAWDEAVHDTSLTGADCLLLESLRTSGTWLALVECIAAAKAEVSALEDIAYDAQKAANA